MYSAADDGPFDPTGFPIRTSTDPGLFGGSPWLFAAFHVLLRWQIPRHPPYALCRLTIASLLARYYAFSIDGPFEKGPRIKDEGSSGGRCFRFASVLFLRRINLRPHRPGSLRADAVLHLLLSDGSKALGIALSKRPKGLFEDKKRDAQFHAFTILFTFQRAPLA